MVGMLDHDEKKKTNTIPMNAETKALAALKRYVSYFFSTDTFSRKVWSPAKRVERRAKANHIKEP